MLRIDAVGCEALPGLQIMSAVTVRFDASDASEANLCSDSLNARRAKAVSSTDGSTGVLSVVGVDASLNHRGESSAWIAEDVLS